VGEQNFTQKKYEIEAEQVINHPLKFRSRCGTHYVKTVILGGEFYALLSQKIRSEEEKRQ